MAKGKKMEEVVLKEEKEVGFGELELKIAKPSLAQDKTIIINGNFSELGSNIQKVVDKYKGTVLTEENVGYVKTLKQQFVSLRTGIERERKEYKKVYIQPASKLIDSMCDELQKIVAEGENALGAQLDEYDQKRKDELTVILKEYVADSVAKHGLRDEYATQIQLLDKYYNKTQAEEDSADDIERQAVELEKAQKEYDSGVELIKAECDEAGFLSETYIRELKYKSATEIILEIKSDKKKRNEILAKDEDKVEVGSPVDAELKQALTVSDSLQEEETRTRVLRVTYRADQAKLMARFFKENDISFEFIKTDF